MTLILLKMHLYHNSWFGFIEMLLLYAQYQVIPV